MDWSKLDAALIAALGPGGGGPDAGELSVFVHVDPTGADAGADRDLCDRLGLGGPGAGQQVRTATLSPAEVDELSDLAWVWRLTLSARLRPLDDEAP